MIQWVVQSNLNEKDVSRIENACRENDVKFTPIYIIPFSNELPDYDTSIPAIYYGSTTMMRLVGEADGMFFDDEAFTMESLRRCYGQLLLNWNSSISTIEWSSKFLPFWKTDEVFIRPNDDNKSFAGEVINKKELREWFDKLQQSDGIELTMQTKVLISEPKAIETEWRLWVVNGKVIASSQYRRYGELSKKEGCPTGIRDFAETACRVWTPHDVFCMDVCVLPENHNPYIVETGCFNSCGFYAADVNEIVKQVTNYYETTL